MSKQRVYELAKELELSSKHIVDKAHSMGIDVKNHMSTLADSEIKSIKNALAKKETKLDVKKRLNRKLKRSEKFYTCRK